MSWVTNVVLSFGTAEEADERMAEVNRFFESVPDKNRGGHYEEAPLASVEPVWDGKGKSLECNLFIGAYNYFPMEEFIAHLRSVSWEDPEFVQLFLQDQEEGKFHIFDVIPTGSESGTEAA